MRVIGEILNAKCKITLFQWNERYLMKLEKGPFEQTFKIEEMDLTNEGDLKLLMDDQFIEEAILRFDEMYKSLSTSFTRHNL